MHRGRIATTAMMLSTLLMILAGVMGCLHASPGARSSAPAACPAGAAPAAGGCSCRSDLRLLLGACVSARTAADHCGVSASMTTSGACTPHPRCEPGRARDLLSGECAPRRDVRGLATSVGILVADDELVGCPEGGELAVADDPRGGPRRLGCVAASRSGAAAACPAGSILGADGKCSRVFEAGGSSRDARVDVVRWMHGAVGPDGGTGAAPLCDALARGSSVLDAPAVPARLVVSLRVPDNDVSLVVVQVRALTPGGSIDPAATAELDRVVAPMIEALRAYGGTATQATLTTAVTCPRPAITRPAANPMAKN